MHPEHCGRWTQFGEHIFHMGWFNHQIENQSQVELALQILRIRGPMSQTEGWCGLVLLSKTVKSKAFKEDTPVPNHFIQESGGIFTRIRGMFLVLQVILWYTAKTDAVDNSSDFENGHHPRLKLLINEGKGNPQLKWWPFGDLLAGGDLFFLTLLGEFCWQKRGTQEIYFQDGILKITGTRSKSCSRVLRNFTSYFHAWKQDSMQDFCGILLLTSKIFTFGLK